jgi:hypothetical protein
VRKTVLVKAPEDISVLNHWLAGGHFERHRISFSVRRSSLEIPFYRVERERRRAVGGYPLFRRYLVPVEEWLFRISHVKNFQVHPVHPDCKNGEDTINAMQYNPGRHMVEVSTAFSDGIDVQVGRFEVELVDTGKVVRERMEGPLTRFFLFR